MGETATIIIDGVSHELPVITGSEGERAIDISSLRTSTGLITLDDGYGNTGSCRSAITFIDGEKGILRYRGIPIEDLAERSSFIETAELLTDPADVVRYGASVGAAAVVLPGVEIGRFALVGAGAVVTRSVPDHAIVVGNPARRVGHACACGGKLNDDLACPACGARWRRAAGDGLAPEPA